MRGLQGATAAKRRGLLRLLLLRQRGVPADAGRWWQSIVLYTDREVMTGTDVVAPRGEGIAEAADGAGVIGAVLVALCCCGTPVVVATVTSMRGV